MNAEQEMVQDFHEKFGAPVGDRPALTRTELRAKLILEEAVETCAAMGFDVEASIVKRDPFNEERNGTYVARFAKSYDEPDFDEVIDGFADVLYVVYGAAVEFGIDLAPFFDEVHRSNMAKEGGATRADGKILKPEGWVPPDIRGIREHQEQLAILWANLADDAADEPTVEIVNKIPAATVRETT